jgi:pantothenate kinase
MLMNKFICANVGLILFVCASDADERTYTGLLKREIKEKIIKANEVIKQKELDKYRTISIIVNGQIIYCHYEQLSENNLPLIICY